MESFEELGVSEALAEALAGEGIETPNELQVQVIPVLRRGTSAVVRGGPGSGILIAYGVPLLERFEAGSSSPQALVLTPERSRVASLATSLSRLAVATGHRVGALGVAWGVPERSDILVATPQDLEAGIRTAHVKVDAVRALVLEQAGAILASPGADRLATILPSLGRDDLQVVVVSDPIDAPVRDFADQHARRAVFLPPEATSGATTVAGVYRGSLRVRVSVDDQEEERIAGLVSELLDEGCAHVLAFFRSEDRAADVGDVLGLRGFASAAPGAADVPVWLGIDALEAREALEASGVPADKVASVSLGAPADADELDRRHGRSPGTAVVMLHARELPHLRRTAREAGYSLVPWAPTGGLRGDEGSVFIAELERVLDERDLLPYLLLLEPLFAKRDPVEVAAALALLLRRKGAETAARGQGKAEGSEALRDVEGVAGSSRPPAWVRVFLSVGGKDGIGPGDLLGAILGETGIARDQVGRIDLRDTFSRVEVHEAVADRVISALNGTTIRGRSVRADFDRQEARVAKRSPASADSRPKGGRDRPGRGRGLGGGRKGKES